MDTLPDIDTLLQLLLVLVVVWVGLAVVEEILGLLGWLLGPLQPLIGLAVVALAVLWLYKQR
ncbi:hypothetical protein ACFQL1_10685 [Halomicroarcula sp. GCM10025709]|uniref:DUF7554 family protein n=1 Tax=Haloarcula TaxID=2237 RepID=UPI0024C251EA|nr:hypothetical protein [Halomicroarcula sp. YJ-61-S]